MTATEAIRDACTPIPGMVRCVAALVPDGLPLGGVHARRLLDQVPIIRAAIFCLTQRPCPSVGDRAAAPFLEYVLAVGDELVVIEGGRRDPRLALIVVCTREPPLADIRRATREALGRIERELDLCGGGMT